MTEQPRTEDGKFTTVRMDKARDANPANTVGVLDNDHISDSVEYVKISRKYLQHALERIEDDEVVEMAVVKDTYHPWGALLLRDPLGETEESVVVAARIHPEDSEQ